MAKKKQEPTKFKLEKPASFRWQNQEQADQVNEYMERRQIKIAGTALRDLVLDSITRDDRVADELNHLTHEVKMQRADIVQLQEQADNIAKVRSDLAVVLLTLLVHKAGMSQEDAERIVENALGSSNN